MTISGVWRGVVVLSFLSLTACVIEGAPSGVPLAANVVFEGCLNPSIEADGSLWQAVDTFPRDVVDATPFVDGVLWIDGDSAEFVVTEGDVRVSYVRRIGVEAQCAI